MNCCFSPNCGNADTDVVYQARHGLRSQRPWCGQASQRASCQSSIVDVMSTKNNERNVFDRIGLGSQDR